MSKLNFQSLPRPQAIWKTIEAYEPGHPEPWVVRLRPLDPMQELSAREFAEQLASRYLYGNWTDQDGTVVKQPEIIAMADGEPVEVNDRLFLILARMERMQGIKRGLFDKAPVDGYIAEELALGAVKMPNAWKTILSAFFEISMNPDAWTKKGSADSAAPSPEPAFN